LPPSWFDKSPDKDFATQIAEMLRVFAYSQLVFAQAFTDESAFFPGWLSCHAQIQRECEEWGLPQLVASFGVSLLERAMLDAICRWHGVSFAQATRENLFGIEPGSVHAELRGSFPRDWLPAAPHSKLFARHTVGLSDPLTIADIPLGERLHDGWPQSLEEYVSRRGVRYFKIKVSNRLDHDLNRLEHIARLLERHLGQEYHVTLDGNEQYKRAEEFEELVAAIRTRLELATLWKNVLVIEQPLDRRIALSAQQTGELRNLSQVKPVIIDESDGTLDAYLQAIELGYRGVSSKNCKGTIKSLLNAGLTWWRNDRGRHAEFVMTGEDLCCVGIIPVQSDLCLVATLGLDHVERNGHHYHPGLSYLPEHERRAALAMHPDLYTEEGGIVGPNIRDGRFSIESLQCPGFGFAVEPDLNAWTPAESWRFESLWV
jgi:hypothetical protein